MLDHWHVPHRQQNIEDFMDEDELADRKKTAVKTSANYDTFGDTAAELAKKAAAADAQSRPSAIPGAIFKDLITPVPDSIGQQLDLSTLNTSCDGLQLCKASCIKSCCNV